MVLIICCENDFATNYFTILGMLPYNIWEGSDIMIRKETEKKYDVVNAKGKNRNIRSFDFSRNDPGIKICEMT